MTKRQLKHDGNSTRMCARTNFRTYTQRKRYAHAKRLDLGHFEVVSLQCEREKGRARRLPSSNKATISF